MAIPTPKFASLEEIVGAGDLHDHVKFAFEESFGARDRVLRVKEFPGDEEFHYFALQISLQMKIRQQSTRVLFKNLLEQCKDQGSKFRTTEFGALVLDDSIRTHIFFE